MAIPAIGAAVIPAMPTPATSAAPTSGGSGFAEKVGQALDNLQATHTTADQLARQAATGGLQDPSQYMIAATEASLATELTVAVRNKAVEAFNSIMSMGI